MHDKTFTKEDDYTLLVVTTDTTPLRSYGSYNTEKVSNLTRTFNFMAAQVTTVIHDSLFESHGEHSGGSAAVSTQMIIQNFSDIDSKEEIKLMHAKLVELGGHPPELSFDLGKRPLSLTRPGA